MVAATWEQLTQGLADDDIAKLAAFREVCRGIPGAEERIHRTEISFALARSFATAYLKSHYLELGVYLLRRVEEPRPRAVVPVSTTVWLNRYSLRHLEQFDGTLHALIREAAETVGPGARRRG
jgi:hypothetical protein